jgi:hypothetical protein
MKAPSWTNRAEVSNSSTSAQWIVAPCFVSVQICAGITQAAMIRIVTTKETSLPTMGFLLFIFLNVEIISRISVLGKFSVQPTVNLENILFRLHGLALDYPISNRVGWTISSCYDPIVINGAKNFQYPEHIDSFRPDRPLTF